MNPVTPTIYPVNIESSRLQIREFRDSDTSDVHEYAADPTVVQFLAWGPNSPEDTKKHLERVMTVSGGTPRLEYALAIELKAETKVVGSCGLVMRHLQPVAYLGYVLNRKYWKQGIMTEAGNALLRFGFTSLELHRIWATCDARNKASARVLENIGMRREGLLVHERVVKGNWRDSYVYAVLKDEWRVREGSRN